MPYRTLTYVHIHSLSTTVTPSINIDRHQIYNHHTYLFLGEKNPIVTLHVVKIPPHPEFIPESTASTANSSRAFNFTANNIMSLGAAAYTSLTDVLTEPARTVTTPCTNSVRMQLTSTAHTYTSASDLGSDSKFSDPGISTQDPPPTVEKLSWREREIVEPLASDYYLARVGWFPDGSVMAQVNEIATSFYYHHVLLFCITF